MITTPLTLMVTTTVMMIVAMTKMFLKKFCWWILHVNNITNQRKVIYVF